jgi:hypothetical protein
MTAKIEQFSMNHKKNNMKKASQRGEVRLFQKIENEQKFI